MLEAENRRLKDTLRSGKEPPDSNPALRKKIIKLSQRNFFLEWKKRELSDRLQLSLRLAQETRDRGPSEQEKKLREENDALYEKVQGLEDCLLKRRTAIDSQVTETVKENGRLQQRLRTLKSSFEEGEAQRTAIEESVVWAQEEGPRALGELKASLAHFREELQGLVDGQERMKELQTELQRLISSESSLCNAKSLARASPSGSQTLPPVLKTLNPSYLTRLGGNCSSSPPPPSPSSTSTSPTPLSPQPRSPSSPQVSTHSPATFSSTSPYLTVCLCTPPPTQLQSLCMYIYTYVCVQVCV